MSKKKNKKKKNEAGRGQGRVRFQILISQTIPAKIFGMKWNNPVKPCWDIIDWYLFFPVFKLLFRQV